jgi:hypothetical protein
LDKNQLEKVISEYHDMFDRNKKILSYKSFDEISKNGFSCHEKNIINILYNKYNSPDVNKNSVLPILYGKIKGNIKNSNNSNKLLFLVSSNLPVNNFVNK